MRYFFLIALSATILLGAVELSNRRAPGFSLMDSQGVQHDPQDDRGKVVIVEFMQTSCPHCQKFSGVLEQVKAKYKDKVAIYSVVTLPDTLQAVQKYISEFKVTSPVLLDCGQVMASYMKITPSNPSVSFPHVFVIDRNGMIRNDYGFANSTAPVFETTGPISADIDKLIGGK